MPQERPLRYEKAKERPEVNIVLKNLENLANSGPGACKRIAFLSGMGDN
jgi:hypothetical protein